MKKVILIICLIHLAMSSLVYAKEKNDAFSSGENWTGNSSKEEKALSFDEEIFQLEAKIRAQSFNNNKDSRQLIKRLNELKDETIKLNEHMSALEKSLLHGNNNQLSIFFSFINDDKNRIDGAELHIDGEPIYYHLYTNEEAGALTRGAIQRLYSSLITTGNHELLVIVRRVDNSGNTIKAAGRYSFKKATAKKHIELKLDAVNNKIEFKEW